MYKYIVGLKTSIYTFLICLFYGLKYNPSWQFIGFPIIQRPYIIHKQRKKALIIGNNFKAISKFSENSIGLVQPVLLHARGKESTIIIGNNVGISGSTLSSYRLIKIGDNVMIGSGCIIMDNDAHNLHPSERFNKLLETAIAPVIIEDDVFIGARTMILKGVTIGKGSVIGAGSVVTKNIPPNVVAAGNPIKIIKSI